MKHACIRRHEGAYAVALMCRVLQVSRSGYYASRTRPTSARVLRDQELVIKIRAAHRKSRETYGSPRVHEELKAHGVRCGRKRVARIMHDDGIRAKRRRQFRVTTNSNHANPVAPNMLDRHFSVPEIIAQTGCGSATSPTSRLVKAGSTWPWSWISRRVVGWSAGRPAMQCIRQMRHTLERGLTLDALTATLDHRAPGLGVLHHSDRGSQYACGDYRTLLAQHGMECSMSRKGDCWDTQLIFHTETAVRSDPCWDWSCAFALTCRSGGELRALASLVHVT